MMSAYVRQAHTCTSLRVAETTITNETRPTSSSGALRPRAQLRCLRTVNTCGIFICTCSTITYLALRSRFHLRHGLSLGRLALKSRHLSTACEYNGGKGVFNVVWSMQCLFSSSRCLWCVERPLGSGRRRKQKQPNRVIIFAIRP